MSDEATTTPATAPTVGEAPDAAIRAAEQPIAANDKQDAGVEGGTEVEATVSEAGAPAEAKETKGESADVLTPPVEKATTGEDNQKSKEILRTTVQHDRKNRAANSKLDVSVLPDTDDPNEIRRQVEFYFSNSNLPTDKYLWELTDGPENKPVPLDKICSFKRMQRFKPREAVVAALRDSSTINIAGDEGKEEITRKDPYELAASRGHRFPCIVYVKGFGDEEPSTQFDLEAFFAQFGDTHSLRLRRTDDNLFKGSVFVEFADAETATKFLALDPPPTWKGHDLKIMSKQAYVDEKSAQISSGAIKASASKSRFFEGRSTGGDRGNKNYRGRGGGRGGHSGHRDSGGDDWKKRREADQKNGFRGGRGGGRGNRGRGDRGRNQDRNQAAQRFHGDRKPVIQTTNGKGEVIKKDADASASASNKRPREDGPDKSEPPTKKVDSKTEPAAAST